MSTSLPDIKQDVTVPVERKGDRALYLRTPWVNAKSEDVDVEASVSGGSIVFIIRREKVADCTYVLRADDLISAVVEADRSFAEQVSIADEMAAEIIAEERQGS